MRSSAAVSTVRTPTKVTRESPGAGAADHVSLVPVEIAAVTAEAPGIVGSRSRRWWPSKTLGSGLNLAVAASIVVIVGVLWGLGGWQYYWTAEDVRAYTDHHRLLRASGAVGRALGVTGLSLMLVMHGYTLRKRIRWMRRLGSVTTWLEFHIFCGVLGPVLITLHTSFKFNGLVSVAYWSMVLVVASGFVGRYLYVRIPRSIRGRELSRDEVSAKARELKNELMLQGLSPGIVERIETFEISEEANIENGGTWAGLLFGGIRTRHRLSRLARSVQTVSTDRRLARATIRLIADRTSLLRRIAYLEKTRRLFELWHVYHKPLAVVAAVIVILHVAVVWYFGYAFSAG